MRPILITSFLFGLTLGAIAQDDRPTNSFESFYKKTIPAIHYQYDTSKQMHNYSENWDFDKDGIADQLYFVGTGGAHLYFFLEVILSSDSIRRNFSFVQSDFPTLPVDYELDKIGYIPNDKDTFFSVFKNERDDNLTIFIKLDEATYSVTKNSLKKKGVDTNLVTISFPKGKTIFKDFIDHKHVATTNGSR